MPKITRPGPKLHCGRAVLFTALLGAALAGCSSPTVQLPASRVARDSAILILNGEPLALEEFDNDFRLMALHYDAVTGRYMRQVKRRLSERVIDRRLLYQEALKEGIRVTRKEFKKALKTASEDAPDDFPLLLKKQGVTVEVWKRGVLLQLYIDKLVERDVYRQVRITPEEVEAYYWSHLEDAWQSEAVWVRHLVVRKAAEMAQVRKLLASGQPFEEVVSAFSAGPARGEGGDWGWTPLQNLPPLFQKALVPLRPGEVSGVTQDGFGYHIFQLLDRRPKRLLPLGEMREKIHDMLLKKEQDFRFDQWMTELKEKAVIQVNQDMAPLVGEFPEVRREKKSDRAIRPSRSPRARRDGS